MDELLTMSKREITRLEVMQRLKEKRLKQAEAAEMLGISVRQVKRLWRAYRQEGAQGGGIDRQQSGRRSKPAAVADPAGGPAAGSERGALAAG